MIGRLNSFQKTMLQWNDLQPYNAIHVAQIAGALDLERLRGALTSTIESHGLIGLEVNREKGTYRYEGGQAQCELWLPEGGAPVAASIMAEIERQLNLPFNVKTRFDPFRFFVVPDKDSFALGLVYFHPIADAEAVVMLMRDMVDVYHGRHSQAHRAPLDLYPRRHDRMLWCRPAMLGRVVESMPILFRMLRNSARPRFRDSHDFTNRFTCFSILAEELEKLQRTARSLDATLNDVFLALLLYSLSPIAEGRMRAPRRRMLSVGTVANIRRDVGMGSKRTFGLFLGSFVVTHEVPDGIGVANLVRAIRAQTQRIKRNRLYLVTPTQLALLRLAIPLFSTERSLNFYQRHYPLWGGITNINMNPLWTGQSEDGLVDYLRAVSTGPATPMVLAVTTSCSQVKVGLTYRSAAFSSSEIDLFQNRFLEGSNALQKS